MNESNQLNKSAIVALTLSAIALATAILFVRPSSVPAEQVAMGRDYTAVTALSINQSEALYLLDNRTGMVGVFLYEPAKGLVFKGSAPLSRMFPNAGAPAPGR